MAETVNVEPAPRLYERSLERQGVAEGIVLSAGEDGGTRIGVDGDPLPVVARLVANITTLDIITADVMPSNARGVEELARRVADISSRLDTARNPDEVDELGEVVERLDQIATNLTGR